jgi:hypothetical protein
MLAAASPGQDMGGPMNKPRDDQGVVILRPTVDKAKATVTVPGAFWNQRLADWVEVAFCGRPSDFLHETLLCATTTRAELEKALREAGFRDADAWADSVKDFPRVRGDRLLVLVQFSRNGQDETYSLDELLAYQGWSTATGPYGFMFKGDPERATTRPAAATREADEPDSIKILRDDPQIALVFKGIQSMSQSFADHPLAYDDWIYPPMNYGRNLGVLAPEVFNSNGGIAATVIFRKVSEEELLSESAKVWHDAGWRDAILKQVEVARAIDKAKVDLWAVRGELERERLVERTGARPDANLAARRVPLLMAAIDKGYATLDAAWADYAATHTRFPEDDPRALATLKDQAAKWREHLELKRIAAEQREVAAGAREALLRQYPPTDEGRREQKQWIDTNRGKELVAESLALRADNKQPRDYWKDQWARLDTGNDPRVDWIRHVRLQIELANARAEAADAGEELGKALQSRGERGLETQALTGRYQHAQARIAVVTAELDLAGVEFEISKRELFPDDPELPGLRERKKALEAKLAELRAATRPAGGE